MELDFVGSVDSRLTCRILMSILDRKSEGDVHYLNQMQWISGTACDDIMRRWWFRTFLKVTSRCCKNDDS